MVDGNRPAEQDRLSWIPLRDTERDAEVRRAGRRLGRKLKAEPRHKTNLIRVCFESSDPRLAARLLNSLAASHIEKHKQVHRPAGEFPFLEQQGTASAIRLEEAESQPLKLSRNQGVVSGSLERDLALQKLSKLDRHFIGCKLE